MTPTVPDGPDTELAAAMAYLQPSMHGPGIENEIRFDREAQRHAATIVRAVLARPAGGRDLTADDLRNVLPTHSWGIAASAAAARLNEIARPCPTTPPTADALDAALRSIAEAATSDDILQPGAAWALGHLADAVKAQPGCAPEHVAAAIRIARPAVARTDGQPPADDLDLAESFVPTLDGLITAMLRDDDVDPGAARNAAAERCASIARHQAAAGRLYAAPADDTAAPDSPPTTITVPLPAAEHDIDGEDTHGRWTQNPAWETRGIEFGVISAWAQGVCIEDVLHDEGNVIELEETARKVLAAIEWHRHYARLLAAESAGQPVRDSQDGGA